MDDNTRFLMVNYGGFWQGLEYRDGVMGHILVWVNPPETYAYLLEKIHRLVQADMNQVVYQIQVLCGSRDRVIHWTLGSDNEVATFLRNYNDQDLVVFVSLLRVNHHGNTITYEYERMNHDYGRIPPQNTGFHRGGAGPSTVRQAPVRPFGSNARNDEDDNSSSGASISDFTRYGRPVIVIDGTHLKGKYRGTLFVAVTQDGNGQIFPLASGVGNVECNESWTWFLRCLQEAFGCPRDLVFLSDQYASIIHYVVVVYPEATHYLCYYHLKGKIVNYGNHVVTRFYDAIFTCNKLEYSKCIKTLRGADLSGRLMDKLLTADPARWARSCCHVPHYEFMTSNVAETWNNKLVWARKLPVISILECIRTIIETWFVERCNAALAHNGELCEEVSEKIAEVSKEASKLIVTSLGDERYKVSFLSEFYVVNLDAKVCDCGEFQCLGIPCIHAAAVIRFGGHDICSFVHPGYSSRNVREMWRGSIESGSHPNQWANFAHLNSIKCYPPSNLGKLVNHE
ncbi:hypothetical protein ACS0TY_023375 [Phlomoides rotata]